MELLMKRISPGFLIPSSAYTVGKKQIKHYDFTDKSPEVGDLVYAKVIRMGQHVEIENKEGRIHNINDGSRIIGVMGNRYAPDYWEGLIPNHLSTEIDLVARSGVVGIVKNKKSTIKDATRLRIFGYVTDDSGKVINTRSHCLINPKEKTKKDSRSKMILVVGTSMNSGKSQAAKAACWAIATSGHVVRASKVTGTASLKDILAMEDAGANPVNDFTHFGYPSTYKLSEEELLEIFNDLDLKVGNNPKNYWVVEIADGILQRETEILLRSDDVKSRIHRLIFAAQGAMGAISGVQILEKEFGVTPDAISGVCASSPLVVEELDKFCSIPSFDNMNWDLQQLTDLLL